MRDAGCVAAGGAGAGGCGATPPASRISPPGSAGKMTGLPPAASAVPGIRAPVPARRSRQSPFHRVEDLVRHVALGKERELDRCSRFPDDRDAIRGYFEPRAGLERVVQDNEIE